MKNTSGFRGCVITGNEPQIGSRPVGPVAKHQPSPEGLVDGSPRLWSAGGATLPTFGVPRLRRSDDVAESMSQPSRAGLMFGYRPYGPGSDSRSIFEFPHRLVRAWDQSHDDLSAVRCGTNPGLATCVISPA